MRLVLSLWVCVVWVAGAYAQPNASVGLVIEHGDGALLSRCAPADSVPMTLSRVLERAGVVFATTASGNVLSSVDFEGGAPGRQWYFTRVSAAGQSIPRATDLASERFGAGDLAYLQYAETPRTEVPATYSGVCDARSRAALVIVHSSGEIVRRCVTFPGLSTTAGRLLDLSGVPAVIATFPFGRAICAIDGEGCPEDDCFGCDAQGRFWGLFLRGGDGTPIASNYGADQTTVLPGDVVVFHYAEFGQNPPSESFSQTCGHDAELSANLHVLDGLTFAVVAAAKSPYLLGDATYPARLRLILPPGLALLPAGDPATLESVNRRDMAAAWVVAQASPEAGRVYHLRVQLETAASEEHVELGWRSAGGKLSDLNRDGRVDKDDLLILREEWAP